MNALWFALFFAIAVTMAGDVLVAQDEQPKQENPQAVSFGEAVEQSWKIGVEVTAGSGRCTGITATSPVPIDWDDQTVHIANEEKSSNVSKIKFRTIDDSVKQMVVEIPSLDANETATAWLIVNVSKRHTVEPVETDKLRFADKAETKKLRKYLLPSPFIESRDKRIVKIAGEIGNDSDPAWTQVRSVFDWVRENVEYKFDPVIKSCLTAMEEGVGDCEEMSSLFIAICRAKGIPARAVWIPGHTYPEFYLVDSNDQGHWYPCQVAGGNNDFGRMPEDRPILQRGDNFRVQGMSKPMRYVQPTLSAKNARDNPSLKWILEKQTD